MEQGQASEIAFRWLKTVKTNCPKARYQASAALDPNNSKILSDTSLGKASSEGSKQQMDAEYLGDRLFFAVNLLLSKLFTV